MNKSTLPTGVRTLLSWISKGTLRLDADIQRSAGQWTNLQKSLLIHSMLAEYVIPPLYFQKFKNEAGETCYSVLEGKQRLSTLVEFISNSAPQVTTEDSALNDSFAYQTFSLNSATPEAVVDDVTYDLANLTFEELSEECKDALLGFRFTIYCIEDATDEEVAEIFARLNNSTPLTKIQQCRGILGSEMSGWLRGIHERAFFTQALSLSAAQARKEAPLEILLQSMLLLDARHESYDYKGISSNDVTRYCNYIKEVSYNEDKRNMISEIVDYLGVAFDSKHTWLKKSNAPMVVVLAKCALEHNISSTDFRAFIDRFSSSENADYAEGMGSGNIKRGKTEIRLIALSSAFEEFFNIDDCCILDTSHSDTNNSASDGVSVPAEPLASSENEELNSDSESSIDNNSSYGSFEAQEG